MQDVSVLFHVTLVPAYLGAGPIHSGVTAVYFALLQASLGLSCLKKKDRYTREISCLRQH